MLMRATPFADIRVRGHGHVSAGFLGRGGGILRLDVRGHPLEQHDHYLFERDNVVDDHGGWGHTVDVRAGPDLFRDAGAAAAVSGLVAADHRRDALPRVWWIRPIGCIWGIFRCRSLQGSWLTSWFGSWRLLVAGRIAMARALRRVVVQGG